jgi:lipopolysaccharide transport system ATP-binding protein
VIRDLRDTLISYYFSMKISHGLNDFVECLRRKLAELSKEQGLLHLIRNEFRHVAGVQESWIGCNDLTVRYENLISKCQEEVAAIFDYCEIDMPDARRRQIVDDHRFEKKAGRRPGEEDVTSHHRKGVSGDWANHFTDRVKAEFKERFGKTLIDAGYEKDLAW